MRYVIYLAAVLLFTACSTVQIETDHNPDYDFSKVSAFAVVHKDKEGDDTLTAGRIRTALNETLASKGYGVSPQEEADVYVLFHTDVRSKTEIDSDYQFVGLYPYHYYFPAMYYMPTSTVTTYEEGTLVIDVVDPDGNRIVWRGIATDRIKSFRTPEERMKYIRNVVTEMFATFPVKNAPVGGKQ